MNKRRLPFRQKIISMKKQTRILIVGAGPTGLTLAVELKRLGFTSVRVVEKLKKLTTRGRALAIIPKTLAYLSDSGVTDLILQDARRINDVELYKDGKIQSFRISGVHPTYDHMTTLEQEDIERCMIQRLEYYGGSVDRGVEFTAIDNEKKEAILEKEGKNEVYTYDILVGADGVGSTVRQLMGFAFKGSDEADEWEQMEIQTAKPVDVSVPVKLFLDSRPVLAAIPAPKNVYRVVTPTIGVEEAFEELRERYLDMEVKKMVWKSRFRVGYRSSVEMFEDSVVVIGDAANVHSPVGGRGMNKGIEDAYLLAKAMAKGEDLNMWERRRKRVDRFIVKRVRLASWVVGQEGYIGRLVSSMIFLFPEAFKRFIVNSIVK